MNILFINNDGGGFADYMDIQDETTVAQFFTRQVKHGDPADFLIRVNRQPVSADQRLCEGDRITMTPVKIEGAA